MHLVFFDAQDFIYDHVVPKGQSITGNYYSDVLEKKLMRHIHQKQPELLQRIIILHQDNAPTHTAGVTKACLERLDIEVLEHPPYSPDLAPCAFWLFPTVKTRIAGRRFETSTEVTAAVQAIHKSLSKNGLHSVFEKWQHRWDKCRV